MEAKMLEELHEIIGRLVDDNNHLPGHEEVVVVVSHEDFKKLTIIYKNKELEKYQFNREILNAILHFCNKIYQKYNERLGGKQYWKSCFYFQQEQLMKCREKLSALRSHETLSRYIVYLNKKDLKLDTEAYNIIRDFWAWLAQ